MHKPCSDVQLTCRVGCSQQVANILLQRGIIRLVAAHHITAQHSRHKTQQADERMYMRAEGTIAVSSMRRIAVLYQTLKSSHSLPS